MIDLAVATLERQYVSTVEDNGGALRALGYNAVMTAAAKAGVGPGAKEGAASLPGGWVGTFINPPADQVVAGATSAATEIVAGLCKPTVIKYGVAGAAAGFAAAWFVFRR
jgi:hypothetical protein